MGRDLTDDQIAGETLDLQAAVRRAARTAGGPVRDAAAAEELFAAADRLLEHEEAAPALRAYAAGRRTARICLYSAIAFVACCALLAAGVPLGLVGGWWLLLIVPLGLLGGCGWLGSAPGSPILHPPVTVACYGLAGLGAVLLVAGALPGWAVLAVLALAVAGTWSCSGFAVWALADEAGER